MNIFSARGQSTNATTCSCTAPNNARETQTVQGGQQTELNDDGGADELARAVKFSHLSDLIIMAENESVPVLRTQPASLAHLLKGDVIHVCDPNSRLDKRIMVVMRTPTGPSMLCLTLCRHYRGFDRLEHHWHVSAPQGTQRTEDEHAAPTLQCILHPPGHDTEMYALHPNVTIYLYDPFTVENTVSVNILGHVEPASMRHLAEKHAELYSQSIIADAPAPGSKAETSQVHMERKAPLDQTSVRKLSGQHDRKASGTEEEEKPRRRSSGKHSKGAFIRMRK